MQASSSESVGASRGRKVRGRRYRTRLTSYDLCNTPPSSASLTPSKPLLSTCSCSNCESLVYISFFVLHCTSSCTPLYFILYSIVLHLVLHCTSSCTPLYFILYSIVLHLVLHCTSPCTPLYFILYSIVLHLVLHCTSPCTPLYFILYSIVLHLVLHCTSSCTPLYKGNER